jgi:PAS domain S-box-containing protein
MKKKTIPNQSSLNQCPLSIKKYIWIIGGVWTLLVAVLCLWSLHCHRQEIPGLARNSLITSVKKDIIYQKWGPGHGGVYVPESEHKPPNPYLSHIEERDITTPSGRSLTLVNPAYMTRQVDKIGTEQYKIRSRITSLNPIRPENSPKTWEKEPLKAFEKGVRESCSLEQIEGQKYMRPLIIERPCLKCLEEQGYQESDVRSGVSASVPIQPVWETAQAGKNSFIAGYSFIWLLGLSGITLGGKYTQTRITEHKLAQQALVSEKEKAQMYLDIAETMFVALDADGKISLINKKGCQILGYEKEEDIVGMDWFENFLTPGTRDEIRVVFKSVIRGEMELVQEYENNILTRSGEQRKIAWHNVPVRDGTGAIVGLLSSAEDITDRKQAEQAVAAYQHQLRSLVAQLSLVEEHERRRIAEHLHDHVGQLLYISQMKLGNLKNNTALAKLENSFDDIITNIREALDGTRSLTHELSPQTLYDRGFEAAVDKLAKDLSREHEIEYKFNNACKPLQLSDDVRTTLFPVVRELLFNIIKHARARKMEVSISDNNDQIIIMINDNGAGFDMSKIDTPTGVKSGFGILNIHERLNYLGGDITIESKPGKGTSVVVTAPIQKHLQNL